MTLEALREAIIRLDAKRKQAHGNDAEQARITAKLEKLYEKKYLMLQQKGRWDNE